MSDILDTILTEIQVGDRVRLKERAAAAWRSRTSARAGVVRRLSLAYPGCGDVLLDGDVTPTFLSLTWCEHETRKVDSDRAGRPVRVQASEGSAAASEKDSAAAAAAGGDARRAGPASHWGESHQSNEELSRCTTN